MKPLIPFTALAAVALSLGLATPLVAQAGSVPEGTAAAFSSQRFTVETLGSGPDVILIPGLSTPRDVWYPTADQLKATHRVHLVQLRGFGDAAGINAEGEVLAPFVAELAKYIKAEGLEGAPIVGHSMGGLAALMLAADHPGLPGKLMIVDALPFIGTIFGVDSVAAAEPRAAQMRDMILASSGAANASPTAAPRDCDAIPVNEAATAGNLSNTARGLCQIGNWTSIADNRVTAQAMYDDFTTDMRPRLGEITVPVEVLYAQDDRAVTAEMAAALYGAAYQGAPNVTLTPAEGSYHFIMLDQPAFFAGQVAAFLGD